jgi:hypothetical protein
MERETKNRQRALTGVKQHTTLFRIERGGELDKSVNRRGPRCGDLRNTRRINGRQFCNSELDGRNVKM